ncbi:MAG: RuBisCO large subunit C-terminal-like domain-containing protein [Bacteroidota bacterium]|nr:RuBisCO large subunit C-terminal-like domain-containing protein [Rhodothermia bacterium]MDW8137586.1 RuBisCO large subunit C-terminal-like domain-containing protein [Bacteroidota bacterium]MDW8285460.1 RuBisCO large subunit C-terminal-like domain-containing protein [Bacteroidota bacterium]
MEYLWATYRLRVSEKEAKQRARTLALEQTVELPDPLVQDPFVRGHIMGHVEALEPDPEGGVRARIRYAASAIAANPAQLLNVLFGNSSLQPDVELWDVELSESVRGLFPGPQHGIAGLRALLQVWDRPLTCTALKPMGLGPEAIAELCRLFAEAGIDLIKDDHGLADHPFCPFAERVRRCQEAVEEAARRTGRRSQYAPNLIGRPEELEAQLGLARSLGVQVVLIAPMLVGLPVFESLVRRFPDMVFLAHPALGGAARIAPEALLGRLFRLLGADAVIFPHAGGRFAYDEATCTRIAERLRGPWPPLRPAFPVPAGGLHWERLEAALRFYGRHAILLMGSALYEAGPRIRERSRAFVENVQRLTIRSMRDDPTF